MGYEHCYETVCCQICGNSFRALKRLKRMVCSIPCRNKLIGINTAKREATRKIERQKEKERLKLKKAEEEKQRRLAKQVHLICPTCGADFVEKASQKRRSGAKFCSSECYHKSEQKSEHGKKCIAPMVAKVKGKLPPHKGVCLKCNQEFYAKYKGKKYCSIACYNSSDEAIARLKENSLRVAEQKRAGFINPKERLKKPCLQCGEMFFVKPKTYNERKYCSRICYREFMAERFDRWVANPETIALPQCYDEYLTQDELPCLIENCGWSGKHLGFHLNLAHGITADDFKELAGFNKTTGLVTPELSKKFSDRIKNTLEKHPDLLIPFSSENRPTSKGARRSLEGKEHLRKSITVAKYSANPKFSRCLECGIKITLPYAGMRKFCSTTCRNKNGKNRYKFEMNCSHCGNTFLGDKAQQKRVESNLEVCCSMNCRQARNGALPKNHKNTRKDWK